MPCKNNLLAAAVLALSLPGLSSGLQAPHHHTSAERSANAKAAPASLWHRLLAILHLEDCTDQGFLRAGCEMDPDGHVHCRPLPVNEP